MWRNRLLVCLSPVGDLLLCAKHLFVDARAAWQRRHGVNSRHHHDRKSNGATVNPLGSSCDQRAIADT
jgi:hypothetical protein